MSGSHVLSVNLLGLLRGSFGHRCLLARPCLSSKGFLSQLTAKEFHSSNRRDKKAKKELSSKPTQFSSSPANVRSLPEMADINEYQSIIVALSMTAFIFYFFLLREENDIDEQLNLGLFERVPGLEEPHLAQAIPRMKARGEDTRQAEARLKELIAIRKMREQENAKSS